MHPPAAMQAMQAGLHLSLPLSVSLSGSSSFPAVSLSSLQAREREGRGSERVFADTNGACSAQGFRPYAPREMIGGQEEK